MGALEKYLDERPDTFDLSGLLDPGVEKIESERYVGPLIYKYFSPARRGFFRAPQFRFSQREVLNDAFEMSRRWNAAKADGLKAHLRQRLKELLPNICADTKLQVALLKENLEEQGQILSENDVVKAETLLQSEGGKIFRDNLMANATLLLGPLLDHVFDIFEARFDSAVEACVGGMGVLSLTEDPLNRAMWSYYADSGAGFVVGIDPQHAFFFNENAKPRTSVLRRISYTDNRIDNFWQNPYYLFLVKNSEYEHEREWRMFKELCDCDFRIEAEPPICLWNVPADMIKSVHFGWAYKSAWITEDIDALTKVGANPIVYAVRPNRNTGLLESSLNVPARSVV